MASLLSQKMKSFASKIAGVSTVDNEANPASAASMMKRKMASRATVQPKPVGLPAKQQTIGVPGAK